MNQKTIYQDGAYLENNPTWHEEDSPWKAGHIARLLARNGVTPQTVCEVGCGAGAVLASLQDLLPPAVEFSGYEFSPQAFERCAQRTRPCLRFLEEDLLAADPALVFDVVMAIDVFEHVEDCFGFLRRLRSRGTWKVFHIPLDLSAQAVLRNTPLVDVRRSVGHLHYFTKDSALATLRETGHEIVDVQYTCGALELPHGTWRTRLLRIPRRVLFSVQDDIAARLLGGFSLMVLAR